VSFRCRQVEHDSEDAPLLPPDVINESSDISIDGTPASLRLGDSISARKVYRDLSRAKLSVARHRKFVYGALYDSIFPGYYEIDPAEGDFNLDVGISSKENSLMMIRLVSRGDGSEGNDLLSSVVSLGRSIS
jgi:hypothetical protein